MRLRVFSLVLLVTGVAAVWACSLNPQPLPPDTYDASGGMKDGAVTSNPEAGGTADTGANDDGSTPMGGDGGLEGGAMDASDAMDDASEDANDAAVVDAGDDG